MHISHWFNKKQDICYVVELLRDKNKVKHYFLFLSFVIIFFIFFTHERPKPRFMCFASSWTFDQVGFGSAPKDLVWPTYFLSSSSTWADHLFLLSRGATPRFFFFCCLMSSQLPAIGPNVHHKNIGTEPGSCGGRRPADPDCLRTSWSDVGHQVLVLPKDPVIKKRQSQRIVCWTSSCITSHTDSLWTFPRPRRTNDAFATQKSPKTEKPILETLDGWISDELLTPGLALHITYSCDLVVDELFPQHRLQGKRRATWPRFIFCSRKKRKGRTTRHVPRASAKLCHSERDTFNLHISYFNEAHYGLL